MWKVNFEQILIDLIFFICFVFVNYFIIEVVVIDFEVECFISKILMFISEVICINFLIFNSGIIEINTSSLNY